MIQPNPGADLHVQPKVLSLVWVHVQPDKRVGGTKRQSLLPSADPFLGKTGDWKRTRHAPSSVVTSRIIYVVEANSDTLYPLELQE